MSNEAKSYAVELQFGSSTTRSEVYEDSEDRNRYEFDTKAELKAFMRGLNAAIGWMEYAELHYYEGEEEIHDLR